MVAIIGVLSLQGNYIQHKKILNKLNYDCKMIHYPYELETCKLLIIPGGESTVISKQMKENGFYSAIKKFSISGHIFGTCAGMILISSTQKSKLMEPLNIMNFEVLRNAYGGQINSFKGLLELSFDRKLLFNGSFIRAPKVKKIGKDIKILASYSDDPVMITDGRHYATSFHPEIGVDFRVYEYILGQVDV